MEWNRLLIKFCIALLLLSHLSISIGASCEQLKGSFAKFSPQDSQARSALSDLQGLVDADDLCAKNLTGRLYFEGVQLPQDKVKAKQIFIDVSNRAYPPGMFNLAYAMSQENPSDPDAVLNLLLGIYAVYVENKEYGYLASKSADFGRSYIQTLKSPQREQYGTAFDKAISENNLHAYQKVRDRIQRSDDIVAGLGYVLLAGVAISGISRGMAAQSATTNNYYYTQPVTSGGNRLYQFVPTGNPQTLYAIPLN